MISFLRLGLVAAMLILAPAPALSQGNQPVRILGFTDVTFEAIDGGDDHSSGFRQGQLILHFTKPLSERWSFFSEASITSRNDGYVTGIERVVAKYRYSDYLKLSVGRYHTPVNWWNEHFHHGQWLQTTAERPEMTQFGGNFVPVHFTGVLGEGVVSVARASVIYKAGLGNGRQPDISEAGQAGDRDTHRAVLGGVSIRPDGFYDLEIGGNVYVDRISIEDVEPVDEVLLSAFLVYHSEAPELIAEYARITHDDPAGSGDFQSDAYYVQTAYRLPILNSRLKPYVRFESLDIDESDPIFGLDTLVTKHGEDSLILDTEVFTAGLRIDLADVVALKAEYRSFEEGAENRDEFLSQISLSF